MNFFNMVLINSEKEIIKRIMEDCYIYPGSIGYDLILLYSDYSSKRITHSLLENDSEDFRKIWQEIINR